jgi:hypothetical protein
MAGLKDIYALSLRPDAAIKIAIGDLTIQLATENLEYKGKLIIHACSYASREEENECIKRITQLGFSPEEVPSNSILAWAKVKEIKTYTLQTFAIDAKLHGYGADLNQFLAQEGWQGKTVYGYVLEEHHYLNLPIMGVGSEYQHGDWWQAETPFEILCFKRCFDAECVDIAETVGY